MVRVINKSILMLLKRGVITLIFSLFPAICFTQVVKFTVEEQEWIREHPIIKHGYEPNWPPYEIYEEGVYKGIVGDYLHLIEKATGIDFVPIENISWNSSLEGLKGGQVKVVPCAGITKAREQYLYFTKPYISDPLIIVTTKESEYISDLKSLAYKKVSVPLNYYTGEMIQQDFPTINLVYGKSIRACLEDVTLGKTDAFVGSLGVVSYYINHHGFTNLKIAAPTVYENTQIGFAVTKDWKVLRDIAQKVLNKIPQKTHNKIRNKWISIEYEHGINKQKVIKYVIYASIFIIGLFSIVLFWNKSLKKEIEKRKKIEQELEETLADVHKKSDERKVLLQEIHHRVKNNLQIIISLLRLQKGYADDQLQEKLNETITRINAISLVHEKVYQTENLANIKLKEYIETLAHEIITSFSYQSKPELKVSSNIGLVDLKPLIPLALILNELITNSLKYGIKNRPNGLIEINVTSNASEIIMIYSDNGTWINNEDATFGLSLIDTFTEQLDGQYTRDINNGTSYHFVFKPAG